MKVQFVPQIIMLVLIGIDIGVAIAKDGDDKEGKHSFWATLIAQFIMLAILYCGGFFH